MSTAAGTAATTSNASGWTPEQGMSRLLELIRTSDRVSDFTPERLSQAFGVEVETSGDTYGHGQEVVAGWAQNFDYSKKHQRFRFSFDPLRAGEDKDMNGICYEFDRLSSELEGMGFSRQEQRGEHGRLVQYRFERMREGELAMWLDVLPQGEQIREAGTGNGRTCVRTINIY